MRGWTSPPRTRRVSISPPTPTLPPGGCWCAGGCQGTTSRRGPVVEPSALLSPAPGGFAAAVIEKANDTARTNEQRTPARLPAPLTPTPSSPTLYSPRGESSPPGPSNLPPPDVPAPAHPQQPARAAFDPPSLEGLHRRSYCCDRPVRHSFPIDIRPSRRLFLLECTGCRRRISHFRVVNALFEQIWPVLAKVAWKSRFALISGSPATVFHAPRQNGRSR